VAFDHTSGRELDQDTGPLRTEPRPAIQPPEQAEDLAGLRNITRALGLLNLGGMIPMGIARVGVLQARGGVQAQRIGHRGHDMGRHLWRMGQTGP
jgi:hypothetical protein